ncbi:unnamed protein product [Rotaria sp. Silwood1]|nr:unnamed protein product [Rotaria sp. Silwood1]CAF0933664.1 unnamed protein product [Rotaria sp. Silwood1]
MKIRQIEDDDEEEENAPFNNSEDDDNDEKIENVRRKFSPCEPCGLLRRSCCFPNLCQHRSGQISQCLKKAKSNSLSSSKRCLYNVKFLFHNKNREKFYN